MPNQHLRILLLLAAAALLLSACASPTVGSPPSPTVTPTGLVPGAAPLPKDPPPLDPTSIPQFPEPSPTPGPESLPDPHYVLTATLDYSRHHLAVDEEIVYYNRSSDTLPELLLIVEPRYYYPDPFVLKSLAWESGEPVAGWTWDGEVRRFLRIPLAQPLPPGGRLALSLAYELNLPSPTPAADVRPIPFGYTARQTNLVDWFPIIPPYLPGRGWLANQAWFFGEHLAYETADIEVNIRLADARPNLTVAASAPAQVDGEWRRYRLEDARNFAWSVSHEYLVFTETVGAVTVTGYSFPTDAAAGQAALKATAEALALYSDLFGPYPRQSLALVEADFLDGMEYDGLYFLSRGFYNTYQGTAGDYLITIAAHETAHQWWYGLVGNDQANEPWLDEGLCTYSERIYYERLHPEALEWWWAYRINFYTPRGWVDGSIYNPEGYRAYRDAVYLNGAVFFEELRKQIGDEAFFAFLRSYAVQYAHRLASGDDFFKLLSEHTPMNLDSLKSTFFQSY